MATPDQKTYLQEIDLKSFSKLEGAEQAFASLYASSPEALNGLEQRVQHIRELLSVEPVELEHFEENMKLIRGWLDENSFQSEGLCLFACWSLNYVQGIPLPLSVPDLLRVGPTPYIRPLAELQDEYENFLIVVANNKTTQILEVTSAVAETADKVRGDIKNHVRKGGWSQQRYSRRRDKELLHYAKEINEILEKLVQKKNFDRIVLLGSQEILAELEGTFSQEVAARVVGRDKAEAAATEDELLDKAYKLYFEEERDDEHDLWERIRAEYLGNGLAVVGPEDILAALQLGRVEEVIVIRDAEIAGVRCRDCEHVANGAVEICPACGLESLIPIDLIDEITRQAQLTSATVEFTDPIEELEKVGKIAAMLRY
jgi:peptide subunit release factor 1 (eRF1)